MGRRPAQVDAAQIERALSAACVDCGGCVVACPEQAIGLVQRTYWRYAPEIDPERCRGCRICEQVCPGLHHLDAEAAASADRPMVRAVLAAATDPDLREAAASGGAATALVRAWLHDSSAGRIALATAPYGGGDDLRARARVIHTQGEAIEASGSHYVSGPTLLGLEGLGEEDMGRLMVVGLPCQVRSARGWAGSAGREIGAAVSLFCSGRRDVRFAHCVLRRLGVEPSEVAALHTRQGESPGEFRVTTRSGEALPLPRSSPLFGFLTRNAAFLQPGCHMCTDPFGSAADVACGDPWGIEGAHGTTVTIARTERGAALLEEAARRGYLGITRELGPDLVGRLQPSLRLKASLAPLMKRAVGKGRGGRAGHALRTRLRAIALRLRGRISSRIGASIAARLPDRVVRFLGRL